MIYAGYRKILGGSYMTLTLQVIMKSHRLGFDTSQHLHFLRQKNPPKNRVKKCRSGIQQAVTRLSEAKIVSGEFSMRSKFQMLYSCSTIPFNGELNKYIDMTHRHS